MQQSDHALIETFQQGDEFAFVALYNRYKGPVYAFCAKMLTDRVQAQDVMQETFIRVYENRQRLLKTSSFKSWLFTIARNQCLNTIKKNSRQISMTTESEEAQYVSSRTPFNRLLKAEQIEIVNRFLQELSPEYREVLVLREYQNLSYEEIAAVTRNTISSVKSRLFKARRKLGEFLKPWMDPDSDEPESDETRPPFSREHNPVLRRVK